MFKDTIKEYYSLKLMRLVLRGLSTRALHRAESVGKIGLLSYLLPFEHCIKQLMHIIFIKRFNFEQTYLLKALLVLAQSLKPKL